MCCLILNGPQMLDVLSTTRVAYLAAVLDGRPLILPLWYELDAEAEIPAVLVRVRQSSMLLRALVQSEQVCMAFSLLREGSVDSVLLWGEATAGEAQGGIVPLRVTPSELSGRRFLLREM